MKKRILAFALSLLLALSTSACGDQSTAGNGSDGNNGSSQNVPTGSNGGSNGFGNNNDSAAYTTLTDWYNGEDRLLLEDTMNALVNELDIMRFFITIEEPDILIYNYQYTHPLDFSVVSREDTAAEIAANMVELGAASLNIDNIRTFRSTYGIPLRVLRVTYLDADGSRVYSQDFTEGTEISDLPGGSGTTSGTYASLQEWMDSSEDAASVIETTNNSLASVGITFNLAVDGNILVYKYYLPDDFWTSGLTEEELTAVFDSMADAGSASLDTLFAMFTDEYGLTVDAVRFAFHSADGTELYSKDFTP